MNGLPKNDMPDITQFLKGRKGMYPGAWEKCTKANDDGSWIRLVARDLNATDSRFGLNAKRDGSSGDISKDCIAWYMGPTDRHVQVYDVIGNHEISSADITRIDQTNYDTIGNEGTARFVHPVTGGGFSGSVPTPVPTPTPIPGDSVYTVSQAINYLTGKKGGPLSGSELSTAVNRAQQLGWDGGPTIKQNIVHQIGDEMFGDLPDTVINATLKSAFAGYPARTNVKITIG